MIITLILSSLVIIFILGVLKTLKDARTIEGEDVYTLTDRNGKLKKHHDIKDHSV